MKQFPSQALPSEKFMLIVSGYASLIENPALKLKFINRVIEKYKLKSPFHRIFAPQFDKIIAHRLILDEIEKLFPGSRLSFQTRVVKNQLNRYQRLLWHLYPFRYLVNSAFLCLFFWGFSAMTIRSFDGRTPAYLNSGPESRPYEIIETISRGGMWLPDTEPLTGDGAVMDLFPGVGEIPNLEHNSTEGLFGGLSRPESEYIREPVWMVEQTPDLEVYSNRLRIITTHTIKNVPRRYLPFPLDMDALPDESRISRKVVGILYHSSESDILPLSEELNASIKKSSHQLMKYVQRIKSYHYLIDRYGRVYRIVSEEHAAFHAGNSVWADDENIYLNLNHAFIGICFEGKDFVEKDTTDPNDSRIASLNRSSISDSQLKSARELTDWLRFKYKINQKNCVTHGLTSVNPDKMLIGYHLDLSRGFPFPKIGLSDKYQEPIPSISFFGFNYDTYFLKIFNHQLWKGIRLSVENLKSSADLAGISVADHRELLTTRYSICSKWQALIEKEMDRTGTREGNRDARERLAGAYQSLNR